MGRVVVVAAVAAAGCAALAVWGIRELVRTVVTL